MSKGVSIHIGLNRVDPAQYGGWSGVLAGCENDALAMQQIAKDCGYETPNSVADRRCNINRRLRGHRPGGTIPE